MATAEVPFIDAKVAEIRERKEEIAPLVEEYHRLEAALSALTVVDSSLPSVAPTRRRGRPPKNPAI